MVGLQMLAQVPYVVPSWCLEALKRRLKFSAAGSGGVSQSFFTAIAVLLKTKKLRLRDVLALVAAEFEALPNSKADYEPYIKAMSAANKPGSKSLFGEYLDLDVTARDAGASATSFPDGILAGTRPIRVDLNSWVLISPLSWSAACSVLF